MKGDRVFSRILPPILYDKATRIIHGRGYGCEKSGERGPNFYDESLSYASHYLKHYTKSPYYFIWTVILDRLKIMDARRVLEVGCGTGQLACAIRDAKINLDTYNGFDFSKTRITHARSFCPEFKFFVADAYSTDLYRKCDYDTVIATEVLEHLGKDVEVIRNIREGSRLLATLPNFPGNAHVRFFKDDESIFTRYSDILTNLQVDEIIGNDTGRIFFLIQGTR